MNGIGIRQLGSADDVGEIAVTGFAWGGADANIFVGNEHVQRVGVSLGIHGDGRNAQILAGTDDSQGDFPAIGDQNLAEHEPLIPS